VDRKIGYSGYRRLLQRLPLGVVIANVVDGIARQYTVEN